jgi:cysteinyl-tRNA synthetase
VPQAADRLQADFTAALADDLNISEALGAVFVFVKEINVAVEDDHLGAGDRQRVLDALAGVDEVLGVLDPAAWRTGTAAGDDADVDRLVQEREEARQRLDWAAADRIRNELTARGIVLEDTAQGTRWKRA